MFWADLLAKDTCPPIANKTTQHGGNKILDSDRMRNTFILVCTRLIPVATIQNDRDGTNLGEIFDMLRQPLVVAVVFSLVALVQIIAVGSIAAIN